MEREEIIERAVSKFLTKRRTKHATTSSREATDPTPAKVFIVDNETSSCEESDNSSNSDYDDDVSTESEAD